MKKIERYYTVAANALTRRDSKLTYERTIEAVTKMALAWAESGAETEDICCIGESAAYTADSLLVGAYWFCTDYSGGMCSLEGACLNACAAIFSPGMTDGPEPESSESEAYNDIVRQLGCEDCEGTGVRVDTCDNPPPGFVGVKKCEDCDQFDSDLQAAQYLYPEAKYLSPSATTVLIPKELTL